MHKSDRLCAVERFAYRIKRGEMTFAKKKQKMFFFLFTQRWVIERKTESRKINKNNTTQ